MVTKNGRPAAILINVDEYTRLKETLDVLSDPALIETDRPEPDILQDREEGPLF